MNQYQAEKAAAFETSYAMLEEIIDELNEVDKIGGWSIVEPEQEHKFDRRFIDIEAPTGLKISCERGSYGFDGKWEFRASGWPTYINEDRQRCSVTPTDLWQPKEEWPKTRAAEGRPAKAIANQIRSRLLKEYRRIYARAADVAYIYHERAKDSTSALRRVTEAAGKEFNPESRSKRIIYTEGNGEDCFRIEYRGQTDVILHLTAEQAVTALEAIR